MKVGVISDVHGNIYALQTCIKYMELAGCEEYLLLGDFVSDTANPVETLAALRKLMATYPCYALRGNREDYMIGQRKVLRGESDAPKWLKNSASGNLLFTYERLTDADIDFFEALPISFVYEKEGYPAITCCHGSPDNTRELMQLYGDNTKQWMEKLDTEYLLAAHTHYYGSLKHAGKLYINTGSSGIAIDTPKLAQCVILHGNVRDGRAVWEPEFLQLPYDCDAAVEDIFASGLYDYAPWFINNNIHILLTGIDLTVELVETANRLKSEATGEPAVWPYIEEKYFAKAAERIGLPDYKNYRNDRK